MRVLILTRAIVTYSALGKMYGRTPSHADPHKASSVSNTSYTATLAMTSMLTRAVAALGAPLLVVATTSIPVGNNAKNYFANITVGTQVVSISC